MKVIKGGTVIAADEGKNTARIADIRIVDDKIVAIEPSDQTNVEGDWQVINAAGMIVAPGFVDDHRHLWQTPLRGLAADLTAPGYRSEVRGMFGPHYTPEDLYIATLAGALDALDSGITTIGDFAHVMNGPEFADASLAALADTGMRAAFGYGTPTTGDASAWYSNSKRGHANDIRRVCKGLSSELVSVFMAARPPYLTTPEITMNDWSLARDLGIRLHLDGGLGGGMWGGVRHFALRTLAEMDLAGADTTYVHCNNLADDEYKVIADTGGHVSISPFAEMNVGHGMPAIAATVGAGIRPSLSGDFVTQTSADMFSVMRAAISASRGLAGYRAFNEEHGIETWSVTSAEMIEFATQRGAHSLGMDDKVGAISEGMKADIIMIDANSLHLAPVNDAVGTLVMQATPRDVDTVLVNGRVVKQAGRLLHHDLAGIRDKLNACRDRLFVAAGVNVQDPRQPQSASVWSW